MDDDPEILASRLQSLESIVFGQESGPTLTDVTALKSDLAALRSKVEGLKTDLMVDATDAASNAARSTMAKLSKSVPHTVATAIEPILDELVRVEERLEATVATKTSNALAQSTEARMAVTAIIQASEEHLRSVAKEFAR